MRPLLLAVALATAAAAQPAPPTALPAERPAGDPELVATFPVRSQMPTGVTVSDDGRVFVNVPRWAPDVPFTVAEVVDGQMVPYPSAAVNQADSSAAASHLISVQSVVIGPDGVLWALDTGRPQFRTPPLAPKLVGIDLATDTVVRTIPVEAAGPETYLNDVRFDLTRGEAGLAFITDSGSGPSGLLVVDLATGESWRHLAGHPSVLPDPRFLPVVEGRPLLQRPADGPAGFFAIAADGIALHADGERLFFRALTSRRLYSVALDALDDPAGVPEATLVDHGDLGFASDGLEADAEGRIYLTNYEDNAVVRFDPDAPLGERLVTLAHGPALLWPDTLSLAADGTLYLTANQLHRQPQFHGGEDLREMPYGLFRIPVDAAPVRLR